MTLKQECDSCKKQATISRDLLPMNWGRVIISLPNRLQDMNITLCEGCLELPLKIGTLEITLSHEQEAPF